MDPVYTINRPPLLPAFELPTRQELLDLAPGDVVKLIFQVRDDAPERMWVILTDCSHPDTWHAVTDNEPVQEQTAAVLPAGTEISFHPLDIIAITPREDIA